MTDLKTELVENSGLTEPAAEAISLIAKVEALDLQRTTLTRITDSVPKGGTDDEILAAISFAAIMLTIENAAARDALGDAIDGLGNGREAAGE